MMTATIWSLIYPVSIYLFLYIGCIDCFHLYNNNRNSRSCIRRKSIVIRNIISPILSNAEFEGITTKSESNNLAIIDFQKSACKPCIRIAPAYEALSEKYDGLVKFYKVDADTSKEALQIMKVNGIRSVPTFQIWLGQKQINSIQGAHLDEVEESIRQELRKLNP